jgi:phage terminase small subunit
MTTQSAKGKRGGARPNSGGARTGAGRPKKPRIDGFETPTVAIVKAASRRVERIVAEVSGPATALLTEAYATLKRVMASEASNSAAVAAAKEVVKLARQERAEAHFDITPLGKKEESALAAQESATGKFAPPSAPIPDRMN